MKRFKKIAIAVMGLSLVCTPVLASCGPDNPTPQPDEKKLVSIAITTQPNKVNYEVGEYFSPTGMVVKAKYDDNSQETVTDYSYPTKPLSESDTKVTITYKGKTATVDITVVFVEKITNISIESKPNKVKYVVGQTFDPTGMKVVAIYNTNRKVVIKDYDYDKKGPLTLEDEVVVISYQTFTANVNITVEEEKVDGIVITSLPTKTAYVKGEEFDPTGIQVSTHYNSGKLEPVDASELTYEGVDGPFALTGNKPIEAQEVFVLYQELMTATFKVFISESRLTGMTVTRQPNIKNYVTGQTFDTTGVAVTATFETGDPIVIGAIQISGSAVRVDYEIRDFCVIDKTEPLTLEDTTVTIGLGGFTGTIDINVTEAVTTVNVDSLKTVRIEGEHMDTTQASLRNDFIAAGRTFVEPGQNASNGQNLCGYNKGSIFEIPIETAKKAKISIVANMSYTLEEGNDINDLWDFHVGEQKLVAEDGIFEYNGGQDYWHWVKFLVGEVEIEPGEHTLKMDVKKGYPNVDYFDFIITEYDGEVAEKEVMEMKLLSGPTKTKYEIGEKFNPEGIQLQVQYTDYTKEIITDYEIDKTEELKIEDEYVTLTYLNEEIRIPITVGKEYGFKILDVGEKRYEAENLDISLASGASVSSDGTKLDFSLAGDVLSFTVYSHEASTVKLFAGFKSDVDGEMSSLITFKLNDDTLAADNSNLVKGARCDISLGEVELEKAGEYTFTIENLSGGIALDYIEFFTSEYNGEVAPHNLESIYVKENPTKTRYVEGETFDTTGMKVFGKYSDRTEAEISNYTIDKEDALTLEDKEITITGPEGKTCTLSITVLAVNLKVTEAKTYRVEAESLDFSNLVHDGNPDHTEDSGDYSSGGVNVGHIANGYMSVYFTTTEEMELNAIAKVAHPNGNKLGERLGSVTIDGTNVTFDGEIVLDQAPGNTYWNYKDVALACGTLPAGTHELRFTFLGGVNFDCIDLTFTK